MNAADLNRYLTSYFYIALEETTDHAVMFNEHQLTGCDCTYADAKLAIANANGGVESVVRVYRINFATAEIKDVTTEIAVQLWQEWSGLGIEIDEWVYGDYVRNHIPASYDIGCRLERYDTAALAME